jgi:hypothetical protein
MVVEKTEKKSAKKSQSQKAELPIKHGAGFLRKRGRIQNRAPSQSQKQCSSQKRDIEIFKTIKETEHKIVTSE